MVILGAGGMAREAAWIAEEISQRSPSLAWQVIGFWQADPQLIGTIINGYPVLDPTQLDGHGMYAIAAIGQPAIRQKVVKQAIEKGFSFARLIHPDVVLDFNTTSMGDGVIICPGTTLTTNITIGQHVIINAGCTVSHDCILEDYATLSPGCHLAGFTHLEEMAFMGIGSVTIENHHIGRQSVVGAGAVVIDDIPANSTAIGIPAKVKHQ